MVVQTAPDPDTRYPIPDTPRLAICPACGEACELIPVQHDPRNGRTARPALRLVDVGFSAEAAWVQKVSGNHACAPLRALAARHKARAQAQRARARRTPRPVRFPAPVRRPA